ncbi:MAG TPA: DUF4389 domain-containing protein [Gaiellaceae bacterium]|jgi:hypothetical protein
MSTDAGQPFLASEPREIVFSPDPAPLDVEFGSPRRQNRWTVAFRGLLVIPQLVAVVVLGIAAAVLVVVGWFAALVLGRLPQWIADIEMQFIAYLLRVSAYGYLLVDEYPPFALEPDDYPIAVLVGASRLSRLKVFFRLLLVIPAYIVSALASNGLILFSPVLWIVTLVLGRMPQPLFSATAAVLRYQARWGAYMYLVTDAYPSRLFGDSDGVSAPDGSGLDVRLALSKGAKWLLALMLALGAVMIAGQIALRSSFRTTSASPALVAAENRFETASNTFVSQAGGCRGTVSPLRCVQSKERAWSTAFTRFASDLSRLHFSGSQRTEANTLADDSRALAQALLAASRAKTASDHQRAFSVAQALIGRFEDDSQRLLGHTL